MMRPLSFMRSAIVPLMLIMTPIFASSQDCEVLNENLKGKYEGDCKKGKAHGTGKAVGKDTYEGDFKSGLPDGKGTYIWSSGIAFTGKWSKGVREGKGIMTYKGQDGKDSIVEGYWKKDKYVGKNEYPYEVFTKTKSVSAVDIEYTPDAFNRISISITNVTGGVKTASGGALPQMRITDMQIMKGTFARSIDNNSHYKKTEKTLIDIQYPFRVKLMIGVEEVEMEFTEKGSYTVDIRINQ